MTNRLFAYGTLRQTDPPAEIAAVVGRFQALGKGVVQGKLYDLGEYPGMVFGVDSGELDPIEGEVYELPEGLWAELDAYEGFEPMHPEESLFVRKLERVRLASDNTELLCWVYEYNRPVVGARRIQRFMRQGETR